MVIPVAIPYSPKTKTNTITEINDTVIDIDPTEGEGIYSFVDASIGDPGEAVLCLSEHFDSEDPNDYETVRFTERDTVANELKGVTRGVEGNQQEWPAETAIQSNPSATTLNDMRDDLEGVENDLGLHKLDEDIHKEITIASTSTPNPENYDPDDIVMIPMETGYDGNGYYLQFPDGTQICYHYGVATHLGSTVLIYEWTFPNAFLSGSQPHVQATPDYPSMDASTHHMTGAHISTTHTNEEVWIGVRSASSNFIAGDTCGIFLMAIGRWK